MNEVFGLSISEGSQQTLPGIILPCPFLASPVAPHFVCAVRLTASSSAFRQGKRSMRVFLVLALMLAARVAVAADTANPLLGSWKLASWLVEFTDTGEQKPLYGEYPKGHLIFLP